MADKPKGTFVFLRGIGRESGHWADFLSKASERFAHLKIVGVDYAGVGQNHDQLPQSNIKAMAQRILNSVVGEPVYIYGHSMGGMVALQAAALSPDRVRGIVVCNSSASNVSPVSQRVKIVALNEMLRIFLEGNEKEREARVLALVSRNEKARAEMLPHWVKLAKERPVGVGVLIKQLWAANRFRLPKLQPFRPPVLILSSLGDELVDPECSFQMAKQLGAKHLVHPWAGHELNLDDTDWTLTQVQNWLSELGSRS